MLDAKNFSNVHKKTEPRTMADVEKQMWKSNVKDGERKNQDFLNTANEDFNRNTSRGIDGQEIIPSTFNIFRDSLRHTSEQLLATLN